MSELNLDKLFVPTWNNKPAYKQPILSINGVGILSFQNISCVIAHPGYGKSSTCEAVISAVINKNVDNLGIKADVNKVMYIDFERTEDDFWNSFDRIMRRAKVDKGTILENVQIISFRNIPRSAERKDRICQLLEYYKPELLLMDGVGDLVDDTNSLEQAIELKCWVRSITQDYKVSVLTTLHPNKNSKNNTPRGHIGSEMLRESENVLAINMNANEVRTLTTDFEHGKARNSGHATTGFVWSDELRMFVSSEVPTKTQKASKRRAQDKLLHEDVIQLIKTTHGVAQNLTNSEQKIKEYLDSNYSDVLTGRDEVKVFFKHLISCNYLTEIELLQDKRNRHYKIHTKYEK